MKKKWSIALIVVLVILCLGTGCSSDSKDSTATGMDGEYHMLDLSDSAYRNENTAAKRSEASMEESAGGSYGGEEAGQQVTDPNRKLVKYLNLEMETKEFDSLNTWIQDHVRSSGGYIENSNVSGSAAGRMAARRANYVIRIPVDGMDSFLTDLEKEGTITYRSENVEDITLNYVDTESHISALRTEQETLLDMLSQSGDLETLLAIQERLTDIRYQLENYESQLRLYDNDVKYSTITVDIVEVEREKAVENGNFGSQLKERISSNFYSLCSGFRAFALWFLGALPFWILLAVLAAAAVIAVKQVRRRRNKK